MLHHPLLAACVLAAPAAAQLDFTPLVDVNQAPIPLGSIAEPIEKFDQGVITPEPFGDYYADPFVGTVFNGRTFFFARTKEHGDELWSTDGTLAGTTRITDINPGPGHSYPRSFVEYQGKLYFAATHPQYGRELFVSDGTRTGTHLVGDTIPGPKGVLRDAALEFERPVDHTQRIVVFADKLFFRGFSPGQGEELWSSDGTAAGTQLFKELRPFSASSTPSYLTPTSQGLYFNAREDDKGSDVWISDGTPAGTKRIFNHNFGTTVTQDVRGFLEVGAHVVFQGATAKTTQGQVGTTQDLGLPATGYIHPLKGALLAGKGYVFDGLGGDLYQLDGTPAGSKKVADLHPGQPGTFGENLVAVNGRLVYVATNGQGFRLFALDANAVATDLGATQLDHEVPLITDGTFVYAAAEGATKLYRTDGTVAGTTALIAPGAEFEVKALTPLAAGGALAFAKRPDVGIEPHVVPASGTQVTLLADLNTGVATASSEPRRPTAIGARDLYFTAIQDVYAHVYRWNEADGLVQVTPSNFDKTTNVDGNVGPFVPLWDGAQLLTVFRAGKSSLPETLWASDGTAGGAQRIFPIPSHPGWTHVDDVVASGNRVYFTAAADFGKVKKLFSSDGTLAGTQVLATYTSPSGTFAFRDPEHLVRFAGGLALVDDGGNVIWTDGTPGSTQLLHAPVGGYDLIGDLAVAHGKLALAARQSTSFKWELRAIDLAGSSVVARFDKSKAFDVTFMPLGPDLWFSIKSQGTYVKTDLTPAGTVAVAGFKPSLEPGAFLATHVGTQPVLIIEDEEFGGGIFDGTQQLHGPVHGMLGYDFEAGDGQSFALAGNGLYRARNEPIGDGSGRIVGGPWDADLRTLWSSVELDQLSHDWKRTVSDLMIFRGQLLAVYNHVFDAGEELYAAPLDLAYVRDIDVANGAFHIEASDPVLGAAHRVSGIGAPAGVPIAVFAGALRDTPVAGGLGQTFAKETPLWLDLAHAVPFALHTGPHWSQVREIPDAPALLGLRIGLQAGYLDPLSGEVRASNALELGLGLGF